MTDDELLLELVSSEYWRLLKREARKMEMGLTGRLLAPSTTLVELVGKEGLAGRLAMLRDFFARLEEQAEDFAKKQRDKDK